MSSFPISYEEHVQSIHDILEASLDFVVQNQIVSVGEEFIISHDNRTYWIGHIQEISSPQSPSSFVFTVGSKSAKTPTLLLNELTNQDVIHREAFDSVFMKRGSLYVSYNDLIDAFRYEHLPKAMEELEKTLVIPCKLRWIHYYSEWRLYLDTEIPKDIVLEHYPLLEKILYIDSSFRE
jgi:hypothetical protein